MSSRGGSFPARAIALLPSYPIGREKLFFKRCEIRQDVDSAAAEYRNTTVHRDCNESDGIFESYAVKASANSCQRRAQREVEMTLKAGQRGPIRLNR